MTTLLMLPLHRTLAEIFEAARDSGCPECRARSAADCDDSSGLHSIRFAAARQAGLITRGREAQWRPCRLKADPMKEAVQWLEQYQRFWDERLDRLEGYLRHIQKEASDDNAG